MAFESINPHSPAELVGELEEAGGVEKAATRSREAFAEWPRAVGRRSRRRAA